MSFYLSASYRTDVLVIKRFGSWIYHWNLISFLNLVSQAKVEWKWLYQVLDMFGFWGNYAGKGFECWWKLDSWNNWWVFFVIKVPRPLHSTVDDSIKSIHKELKKDSWRLRAPKYKHLLFLAHRLEKIVIKRKYMLFYFIENNIAFKTYFEKITLNFSYVNFLGYFRFFFHGWLKMN